MNQSALEKFDEYMTANIGSYLWDMYCDETGKDLQPGEADDDTRLDFIDRVDDLAKQHMMGAVKARANVIYWHIDTTPAYESAVNDLRQKAEQAKRSADIGGYHQCLNRIKFFNAEFDRWEAIANESADLLLDHHHLVEHLVTPADMAFMLDIPLEICERYAAEHKTPLAHLLCSPPEDASERYQRFSGYFWRAMWRRIKKQPVIHRQMNRYVNEILGEPVLPMPEVPKPTLVATNNESTQ